MIIENEFSEIQDAQEELEITPAPKPEVKANSHQSSPQQMQHFENQSVIQHIESQSHLPESTDDIPILKLTLYDKGSSISQSKERSPQ